MRWGPVPRAARLDRQRSLHQQRAPQRRSHRAARPDRRVRPAPAHRAWRVQLCVQRSAEGLQPARGPQGPDVRPGRRAGAAQLRAGVPGDGPGVPAPAHRHRLQRRLHLDEAAVHRDGAVQRRHARRAPEARGAAARRPRARRRGEDRRGLADGARPGAAAPRHQAAEPLRVRVRRAGARRLRHLDARRRALDLRWGRAHRALRTAGGARGIAGDDAVRRLLLRRHPVHVAGGGAAVRRARWRAPVGRRAGPADHDRGAAAGPPPRRAPIAGRAARPHDEQAARPAAAVGGRARPGAAADPG